MPTTRIVAPAKAKKGEVIELKALILPTWQSRSDRGAEERLARRGQEPLISIGRLRQDPHLEMHTRGG